VLRLGLSWVLTGLSIPTGYTSIQEKEIKPPQASVAAFSHYDQAENLARDGKYAEALEEYRLEVQENPRNEAAYFGMALAQTQLGRTLDAIHSYLEALKINPDLWAAELNLGILLMGEKDWGRALFHLDRARSLNPKNFQATFYTAKAQALVEKPAEAEQLFHQALPLAQTRTEKFDAYSALGAFYFKQKNYLKAEQQFIQAREYQSETENVDLDLAELYYGSGQLDKALEFLQKSDSTQSKDPAVHELIAKLLVERKDFDGAAKALERAIQLEADPSRRQALYFMLAGMYQEMGRTDDAIQRLRQLAQLSDSPEVHFKIGTLHLHKRELEEAKREFQQVLVLKPDFAEAYSNLGAIFMVQESYPEAILALSRFKGFKPEVAGTYFYLGVAYDKLGDYPKALASYQKYLEIGKGQDDKLEFQARERAKLLAKRFKTR
jgi:tetratricopeptide (TPR) repeat protein